MATVHIIGAGISGLTAATALAAEHVPVKLYEASPAAGGRCRSSSGDIGTIDHGLHLIAAHDRETFRYLDRIGARDRLVPVKLPRLPAASLCDYAALAHALIFPHDRPLADFIAEENPLYTPWAASMARTRLHTPLHEVAARAVRDALLHDRNGLWMAANSLTESFIAPALHFLEYCGGSTYFGHALRGWNKTNDTITALNFARKKVALTANDIVILATPPHITRTLLADVATPQAAHSAITLHFTVEHGQSTGSVQFVHDGIIDILRYGEHRVSVSLRVADGQWHSDQNLLATRIWQHLQKTQRSLRGHTLPKWAIWREKYAGHRMDPISMARAATTIHPHPQCILAGDWLDPARPASIESAAASGHTAAAAAYALIGKRSLRMQ